MIELVEELLVVSAERMTGNEVAVSVVEEQCFQFG